MHREAMRGSSGARAAELFMAAQESWDTALTHGEKFGFKNFRQVTWGADGHDGFMMDCDTTGIEPDLALEVQEARRWRTDQNREHTVPQR